MVPYSKESRRQILKKAGLIGVGSTAGIAGCIGDDPDPDDPDDPADTPGPDDDDPTDPDDDFPTREIEMLVPYSPGGGMDAYARLFMAHLPKHLPHEVNTVVRNVTGGGGISARNIIYNAEPDGHLICHFHLELSANTQLAQDVTYNVREFSWLGSFARADRSVFGGADVLDEYPDWDAFTQGLDAEELIVPTQPVAGTAHLIYAVLSELSNDYDWRNVRFVHHDGTADFIPGLLTGEFHASAATTDSALDFTEDEDDLELFFVVADEHDDHPSAVDFGIPQDVAEQAGSMLTNFRLVGGPPGIPEGRLQILRQAFWDTLHDDEFLADAEEAGRPVIPERGADVPEIVESYIDLWEDWLPLTEELRGEV